MFSSCPAPTFMVRFDYCEGDGQPIVNIIFKWMLGTSSFLNAMQSSG